MPELVSYIDRPSLFIACVIVAIPAYFALGSAFYDDWDDFLDNLRLWYQPWWLSALRGEWNEDQWASIKLLFFIVICAAMPTGLYKVIKYFL